MKEQYIPTATEIQKAESMMSEEQIEMSIERLNDNYNKTIDYLSVSNTNMPEIKIELSNTIKSISELEELKKNANLPMTAEKPMSNREMVANFFIEKNKEESKNDKIKFHAKGDNYFVLNRDIKLDFQDQYEAADFLVKLLRFWKDDIKFGCDTITSKWAEDGEHIRVGLPEDEWIFAYHFDEGTCCDCNAIDDILRNFFSVDSWNINRLPFFDGSRNTKKINFFQLKEMAKENDPALRALRMRQKYALLKNEMKSIREDYNLKFKGYANIDSDEKEEKK